MRKLSALMAMAAVVAVAGEPVTASRQKLGDADYAITFTAAVESPVMMIDLGLVGGASGAGAIAQLPPGGRAMERLQSHLVECPRGWAARYYSGEAGGFFISLVTSDKSAALSKAGGPLTFRLHNLPSIHELVNAGFNCTLDMTTFQGHYGKIQ